MEATTLQIPARPDLVIVLHMPVPGTGTEAGMGMGTYRCAWTHVESRSRLDATCEFLPGA